MERWKGRVTKTDSLRVSLCQGYFRDLYRLYGGTEGKLTNA